MAAHSGHGASLAGTCSLQAFRALHVTDTRIVDTLVAMAAAAAAAHRPLARLQWLVNLM